MIAPTWSIPNLDTHVCSDVTKTRGPCPWPRPLLVWGTAYSLVAICAAGIPLAFTASITARVLRAFSALACAAVAARVCTPTDTCERSGVTRASPVAEVTMSGPCQAAEG